METKLILFSVPIFITFMLLEWLLSLWEGQERYRFQDTVTNLGNGIGQGVVGAFVKTLTLGGYVWLFQHARLATHSARSPWAWIVLFFGVDLGYYWFHRAAHRVNFLWAAHVVHHQSEEYNYSVALRQSWFGQLLSWVFYLPLAVAGFTPEMFLVMSTLNTLYQFLVHTRRVRRLGPLEWVLNTPSHHRVHHGIDPRYIDKNYAGVLIIWDRLLGTFKAEEEEPHYGLVHPLGSYNPLWANLHYWVEMAGVSHATRRWRDKLWTLLAPPEWRPADLGGPVTTPPVPPDRVKYAPL